MSLQAVGSPADVSQEKGRRGARGPSKCASGIRGLDDITGGGLPRGRPTLICGGAGCGKTLLAMEFLVRGAIDYGEHGVFIAFEETAQELARNVASLGYDVQSLIARRQYICPSQRNENEI